MLIGCSCCFKSSMLAVIIYCLSCICVGYIKMKIKRKHQANSDVEMGDIKTMKESERCFFIRFSSRGLMRSLSSAKLAHSILACLRFFNCIMHRLSCLCFMGESYIFSLDVQLHMIVLNSNNTLYVCLINVLLIDPNVITCNHINVHDE